MSLVVIATTKSPSLRTLAAVHNDPYRGPDTLVDKLCIMSVIYGRRL